MLEPGEATEAAEAADLDLPIQVEARRLGTCRADSQGRGVRMALDPRAR